MIQGFTMGLAYVAPIGMQNMFVINSALTRTRNMAYLTALIVIFFDITLALACFLGMGALMEHFPAAKFFILAIGGLLVVYIGISLLRDKGGDTGQKQIDLPVLKIISTACVVTWFNPQAIIDGTMLLGAFRAAMPEEEGWFFLYGVMSASFVWFMGISVILQIFQSRFTPKIVRRINIICGVVIVGYGIKLLAQFGILIFP